MISRPLVKFVLTAAFRDRLLLTLLLMIATGAAIAVFLGAATITEKESFALVFGASGLRFLGVAGIVLFSCFYTRRCFETKEVEFLLSRPLSRMTFLISHATAFALLAVFIAVVVSLAVFFLGRPQMDGLALWMLSIAVEFGIMAAVALFFSMVLSSAAGSALATFGLYVLARLMGTLLGIAQKAPDNVYFAALNNAMEIISVLIPRLDLMGQTSWLVYGVGGSGGIGYVENAGHFAYRLVETLGLGGFMVTQGALSCLLLLSAAAFDFLRREF
jgi:ABC-type transport system involved in multi-copper enzyme maturation permease subunit